MPLDLFGGSSSSKTEVYTTDARMTGTDSAKINKGQGATMATDSAKVNKAKGKATIAQDNAMVFQSTVGAGANTGLKVGNLGAGASLTIQDGSKEISDFASSALSGITDSFKSAMSSTGSTMSAALDQVRGLAETRVTDNESQRNKLILYLGAGLILLGALYMWLKKG